MNLIKLTGEKFKDYFINKDHIIAIVDEVNNFSSGYWTTILLSTGLKILVKGSNEDIKKIIEE